MRSRAKLDTANFWTMVDNQPATVDGQIRTVEVFAGASGRPLKLGIYRPEGTGACRFRLLQEYTVDSVPFGRSTVKMSKDILQFWFFAMTSCRVGFILLDFHS